MRSFSISALCLVAGVLLICLLAMSGCEPQALDVPAYPTKPALTLELQKDEQGGEIRHLVRDKDGYPVSARVEYRNGGTADVTYYPSGNVKETTEYYPETDGRRIKRFWAKLSEGGKYLKDELYRADGSLARQGHRHGSRGTIYDVTWFHPDGLSVMRHKLIKDDVEPFTDTFDEKKRLDGSPEFVMKLMPDGRKFTEFFTTQGLRTHTWLVSNTSGLSSVYEEFYPDGKTTAFKAVYDPQTTSSEEYRPDGTLELARIKTIFGEIDVFAFDNAGKVVLRQKWRFNDAGTLLRRVQVYAPGEIIVKMIQLGPDGRTPTVIESAARPGDRYGSTRTFRRNGSLEKVVVRDATGKIASSHWYAETENIRENLPGDWIDERSFREPPAVPN